MRLYEPIWEKLKALSPKEASTKGVSVTAPKVFHKRIIKAVKKEKYNDIAFRILKEDIGTLSHVCNGSILTFYLTYPLTSKDF